MKRVNTNINKEDYMIPQDKYVPLLKCKKGEFVALKYLPETLRLEIVPVADLVPTPNNKSFEEHINSSIGYIQTWPNEKQLYIDG